ncbi:MAG: MurT ligase domain-containing protein [Oscillospiraceae bacterium]|nr:MurT ligase domain-containing protein [Oscillospiraceae bacterium]
MFILATKILIFLMRLLGGGSSKPGELILKIDKRILAKLTRGYNVILVTGTNGKTTTCSMIYNIMRRAGLNVINNSSGANMPGGIVTCFAANYKFFDRASDKYAIIEVDEAYLKRITAQIKPKAIIVTNVFQDQVDRYGDIDVTFNMIMDAIKNTPESTLILNGDEPLFGTLPVPNPCVYYGFNVPREGANNAEEVLCKNCGTAYAYKSVTFSRLGDYACGNCGQARPRLDYTVGGEMSLALNKSVVTINEKSLSVGVPGFYNVYNALCAYAVSSYLGISHEVIAASLAEQVSKFGRFEVIPVDESELVMLLIKNPAGANQCIDTVALDDGNMSFLIMLNDNAGDGTDISWINDTNFEKLASMDYSNVIVGGTRAADLNERLKSAGLNNTKICGTFDEILAAVSGEKKRVYALLTYTAMITFRKYLAGKGYTKGSW